MRLPAWLEWLPLVASFLLAYVHCENVFGIVGENFTFPVKIDQKMVEILWTKNKNKVAEWEGQNKPTYFTSLRNRSLLNKENGHLTIFNLKTNDNGSYMLKYLDSVNKNYNLTFTLAVLAPPPEPEISCNISGDNLVLKCTANFQEPLKYAWKFSSSPVTRQTQEVSVPKVVDASEKATCFIKFSQTEKSSEILLTRCFPDKRGDSYHERNRGGLIAAVIVFIAAVGIGVFLCRRRRTKSATENAAQRNSPVHGSGEHEPLCSVDSQEQPNSERANSSQVADSENEKPEADKELNEDSHLKDKQMVNDGVKQEELSTKQNSTLMSADDHGVTEADISKKESSSLQDKHVDDHGVNEEEVTQGAEDGSKKDLNNSPSCSEEDIKS